MTSTTPTIPSRQLPILIACHIGKNSVRETPLTKVKWTARRGTGTWDINDKEGKWIASCKSEEVANHIVQTHNSFYGLLEALTKIHNILKDIPEIDDYDTDKMIGDATVIANIAIAKAEE